MTKSVITHVEQGTEQILQPNGSADLLLKAYS